MSRKKKDLHKSRVTNHARITFMISYILNGLASHLIGHVCRPIFSTGAKRERERKRTRERDGEEMTIDRNRTQHYDHRRPHASTSVNIVVARIVVVVIVFVRHCHNVHTSFVLFVYTRVLSPPSTIV